MIRGECELITLPSDILVLDDRNDTYRYKLHEFDIAVKKAALEYTTKHPLPCRFMHDFTPAICATLMYQLAPLAAHLYELGLQDLLPAIVHYYL